MKERTSRSRQRPRRAGAKRAWTIPAVLLGLCLAVASVRDPEWKTVPWRPTLESSDGGVAVLPPSQGEPRLIYPYSVVPGGIENATELTEALAKDPVVLEHYRGFSVSQAHIMTLAQPKLAFVSYRVKDKVYWTRNRVQVTKGEKLISDGKELIRGRCGNRISDAPRSPVAPIDPPEVSAGAPLLPLPFVPLVKPADPPASAPAPVEDEGKETHPTEPAATAGPDRPAGGAVVTPIVIPIGGGGAPPSSSPGAPSGTPSGGSAPTPSPSTTPPAPTPEPATPAAPPSTGPGAPAGAPSSPPPVSPPLSAPPTAPTPPSITPGSPPPASTPSPGPGPSNPSVAPPPGAPPGPLEPPLPGSPAAPNGVTPPGPAGLPQEVIPPPGVPGTTPAPPPVTPVPEPSTYLLIGGGLALMALLKRRHGSS